MSYTNRSPRASMIVSVIALYCVTSCGPSAPTAKTVTTPPAQFLTGNGTKWQVVAKDPKAGNMTGIALNAQGDIYVAEISGNQIAEYSLDGDLIRTFGTAGSGPGQLNNPAKVAVDSQGTVYVSDNGNNRIQKFSATGQPLAQWGGVDASSEAVQFDFPIGLAVDARGDVFVVDAYNHRIQMLSPQGLPLRQWSSQGSRPGPTRTPYDIALDAKGDVFLTYILGDDGIEEFSAAGTDDGPLASSGSGPGQFNTPTGISIDWAGNVFVLDTGNNRLQELSSSGQYVAQWAGPTSQPFLLHSEMAMDGAGNVYVTDDNVILRICVNHSGCQ